MFPKPAFGANTSGFGMQSTFGSPAAATASPFGGFKPATAGTFGAPPAFGASTSAQPATGTGLFGTTNTTGGLFGTTATPAAAPAFGASTSGFGFGANPAPGGGLFNTSTAGGLFQPQQNNTAFGAKPAGFGFGGTTAQNNTSGLFGNTQQAGTGLFGQQNNTMSGGGLFANNTGAFGGQQQQQPAGTAHVKYSPLVGTDVVVKAGASQNINIKHHCITCMKEYEGKSLEELRLEDYTAGNKGSTSGVFGFQQQENKPLFGATNTFGQPATTSAPSVFGAGALNTGGFGQPNTFSFGGATQTNTNTTSLFGAQKPAFGATNTTGTGLFGAPASTQASTFGTNTSTFGFGSNLQNQSTGGLFGAKPATTGFGAAPASTGFGSFGATGGLFGAKPLQTQAPTFGAPQPGVGSMAGGFGTSTSASGGLFGTAFGKPATTQPSFGFGATQPLGMNTGLGANAFGQNKPAVSGFGNLGGGMFPQQPASTFRTGLDSGLGSGIFGNNSSLGGSSLGMGMNANNNSLANNSLSGASAAGNVHDQILALAARPYGDSPLFKDLPDSSTTSEDMLKPTNPQAQAAVMARSQNSYRVTSPPDIRLALRPRTSLHDKKSLFDGLEESDASLEDKLTLKPSRKRLVLRPNQRGYDSHDSAEHPVSFRSQEEPRKEMNGNTGPDEKENSMDHPVNADRVKQNIDFQNNNNLGSSERQSGWNSSKVQWSEKGQDTDEPTPRIYPNLEKDLQTDFSDRRSSWLTTKMLRKPLASHPDSAENSVRELGVRSPAASLAQDKETVDTLSVSEDENVAPRESTPHPTGVKCTRPGYYTIPLLDEMIRYMRADGSCKVPHLTIGRTNYGNVHFDSEIDVAGLDIDALVYFLNKEVIVYPEDADKPPVGEGLNRRAIVTLDRIWPRDKSEKRPIDDPDRLLKMDYEGKLRRVCDKHDTKFIEYRPQTGSWVFRVEHFSKYGLTDSDEEDDITPEVLKRQLVNQSLQKNAAPAVTKPLVPPSAGLGGLGLSGGGLISSEDTIFAMTQTSINLLSSASKAFDMDTAEENTESHSLYQDNRAFGVKSPTSELARLENRQSADVQLMKASLYADADIEDDVSISTGDQLVPMSAPSVSIHEPTPTIPRLVEQDLDAIPPLDIEEVQMKPLIVEPHTIVLRYHRKVPPFKRTIAGRLNAGCLADMSVCRARHSRVGFGPASAIVYPTSLDSLAQLPNNAELCDLSKYVTGRTDDDWSEPIVARLALSQPDNHYNVTVKDSLVKALLRCLHLTCTNFFNAEKVTAAVQKQVESVNVFGLKNINTSTSQEVLSRHLESLFEYSTWAEAGASPPRLQLAPSPKERYAALQQLIRDAETYQTHTPRFGVTGTYCLEVWKLCDALWGADLENDGIPGTNNQAIVSRYRKFLAWLTSAVSDITDADLSKPTPAEKEDDCDGHSARVWTLLLGGRVLEACKVARENGDLNMATLIAQAAGDPSFRSLIARQLTLWRECGADGLISTHKMAILQLISGSPPREQLCEADWMQALYATAKYLCPQVPSLEQVIQRYEAQFTTDSEEDIDLAAIPDDEMGMKLPLPPYVGEYDVTICKQGTSRRVLDLRYVLLRSRATLSRPAPRPANYSPDPLDCSLCFLLGVWFGNPSTEAVVGVSEQLEAGGAWHRAVHALCYLPDDNARAHLIRGVISRNAPAKADTPELARRLELMKKLKVPEKWLLLAQAHRAKYERLPRLEATHLVGAEQWNAAHKVLIEELLPEAVLADDLQSIAPLLEAMSEAARRNEVSGWQAGGQALHHYMHVCDEIRKLVSLSENQTQERGSVNQRLEALRPVVAAACRALGHLPAKTPAAAAARAEMGARLVQLALAAGSAARQLSALLHALRLPPDCTAHAHHKITTDLAEQASELCIETATDSPAPSHHRAATEKAI